MSNRGELAALRSTADGSSREPAGGGAAAGHERCRPLTLSGRADHLIVRSLSKPLRFRPNSWNAHSWEPAGDLPICRHFGPICEAELLLAMQKVEGSNPFSRSRKTCDLQVFFVSPVGKCVRVLGQSLDNERRPQPARLARTARLQGNLGWQHLGPSASPRKVARCRSGHSPGMLGSHSGRVPVSLRRPAPQAPMRGRAGSPREACRPGGPQVYTTDRKPDGSCAQGDLR